MILAIFETPVDAPNRLFDSMDEAIGFCSAFLAEFELDSEWKSSGKPEHPLWLGATLKFSAKLDRAGMPTIDWYGHLVNMTDEPAGAKQMILDCRPLQSPMTVDKPAGGLRVHRDK